MNEEFDILKYTFNTLKVLDIPVYFSSKKEVAPPLVLFNITSEKGDMFWEDEEQVTVFKITVNIFARENYVGYKNKIIKLMKEAGFIRIDVPSCIYLEDIDLYNQPINFKFYKELN